MKRSRRMPGLTVSALPVLLLFCLLWAPLLGHADMKANSPVDAWDIADLKFQHSLVKVYWNGGWVPFLHQIDTFDSGRYSPASCLPGESTIYGGMMDFALYHEDNNPVGAKGFQETRNWSLVNCDRDGDGDFDNADKSAQPPQAYYQDYLIEDLVTKSKDIPDGTRCGGNCLLEIVTTLEVVLDKDCDGSIDPEFPRYVCFYAEARTPLWQELPLWKGNPQARVTAGGGDQTVSFSPQSPLPTAVDLASFTAVPQANAIELSWETVSELDNLGFNLYRAESPDSPRVLLNEGLISSLLPPGSLEGAAYTFVDDVVLPGITYHYWLEDVDVYGLKTQHGPVSAGLPSLRWFLPSRPRPRLLWPGR